MKNNEEFKKDIGSYITTSELEMEFENISKTLTSTLNIIPEKSCNCCLVSCPCGNDYDLLTFANFNNEHKGLIQYITSRQYTDSFSLSMLYKAISLLNIPLNLKLSDIFSEHKIYQKEIASINGIAGFFSEGSLIYGTRDVLSCHSRRLNATAREILKRPLLNQQAILDPVVNHGISRSVCSVLRKSLELNSSSSCVEETSFKSKFEMKHVYKQRPEVKFSEMKPISSPSYLSTSTTDTCITTGELWCFQKCERPYFVFSSDAPQLFYVARPKKIVSSCEKAIDYIYMFYLNDSKNSDCIAKMKVTSSIVMNQNMVKTMETEFVLYGSQEELSKQTPKSYCDVSKTKSFPKKITKMFRPITMAKNKHIDKVGGKRSMIVHDVLDGFLPNFEMTSIIVKESLKDRTDELKLGGWGLKFLDKARQIYTSPETLLPQHFNEKLSYIREESARSMNIVIPAGFHGGPHTQIGGPASLVDRWRSGGHCDCGGWDIGCPVRVLTYDSNHSNTSSYVRDAGNLLKSVNLFMEGTKNGGNPTLSIVNMREGVYSIYFKSTLSALQSFSIAIAVIHTKFSELFTSC